MFPCVKLDELSGTYEFPHSNVIYYFPVHGTNTTTSTPGNPELAANNGWVRQHFA